MQTAQLKKAIIERVNNLEDKKILNELLALLKLEEKEQQLLELSEKQIEKINQGLSDIENGDVLSNEEANKEIDEWLKR